MRSGIEALRGLVQRQRARWRQLQVLEGAGLAVSGVVACFLAAVLLDNFAQLPAVGRWLAAGCLLAAWGWCGRLWMSRWRRRNATDDEIALAIERRATGGVQNRLINALQIGRSEHGPAADLGAALVHENWRHLEARPLPGAMAAMPAAFASFTTTSLLVALVAGWLWQPARFTTAATRILLPFATIDPVYHTVLVVSPGDIEAEGDVTIRVRIRGERPNELAILLNEGDRRSTRLAPVAKGQDTVTYTIENVQKSLTYAVRGGDFTSAYYRIDVPTPARLARVHATYRFPDYIRLPERTAESAGDLEAVEGTLAATMFVLDHAADTATLVLRAPPIAPEPTQQQPTTPASGVAAERRVALQRKSPTEFSGEILFSNLAEYRLETQQGTRPSHATPWHGARVVRDEPPKLELSGLPASGELSLDSPLPLQVSATDDFGLARCGLFARRVSETTSDAAAATDWTPINEWACDGKTKFSQSSELSPANFGAAEGDRLELVAQAMDEFPQRSGQWTPGQVYRVIVAGDGAQLQILYEQILRSEAELAALAAAEQRLHESSNALVRKLDADPAADGNVADRVKELLDWAAGQSREQGQARETAGRVAKEMAAASGNSRLSLGMLADTEMIRVIRVLDSVSTRDDAAGRRAAITEARATQQRTLQSLQQILEQYIRFRQDWELAHMTPFLKMLADRQATLRDESLRRDAASDQVPTAAQQASARRQAKLAELCGLASAAFSGLAERTQEIEAELADAFAHTASALSSEPLTQSLASAGQALSAADWAGAANSPGHGSQILENAWTQLQEAQAAAAQRMLADLTERAESDLAAQADLEQLKAGSGEDLLDEPDGLKLEDIVHMAEVAQAKKQAASEEEYVNPYLLPDSAVPGLQRPDTGMRQEFDILKLATAPGKTPSFPAQSDREGNRVKPHIQEEFEDLVGDLLEEEDEMKANYESFNLNAAFNINEPGEVGKQGGDLNSTAAAAATGNQKPPTTNVGGASRVGRQGARAHGAAMGNESINRRGRDKVQEGQERVPDQAGSVKETKSEDPQEDTSTGVGGRKVESDDAKFSQSDAGEWTDDMAERMQSPQDTQYLVERQGAKLDASVAEMMRDMTSKQEQTLERLKSIRKELKNLYLPTEHLDELIDQMQANLHSLHERPSVEVFLLQQQTLEEMSGALAVFHQAHSGFQQSLPREQFVRGRVLDDPTRATPPGYEEAVQAYYRRLISP